jgi:hypothetical protein
LVPLPLAYVLTVVSGVAAAPALAVTLAALAMAPAVPAMAPAVPAMAPAVPGGSATALPGGLATALPGGSATALPAVPAAVLAVSKVNGNYNMIDLLLACASAAASAALITLAVVSEVPGDSATAVPVALAAVLAVCEVNG